MKAFQLRDNFYWVGALDSNLRTFDIIMTTDYGTTYNSYLMTGEGQTVLFEGNKDSFWEEFSSRISDVTPIDKIDYLIVNHTEPDHAGAIERLLDINPGMHIIGTVGAIGFLKQLVNREFTSTAVKNGNEMTLAGKTIRFYFLPNLHWPDTMYSYIVEDRILVTCDSFGSHYSEPGVLRSAVTNEAGYWAATKIYFDDILAPFKTPFMTNALKVVRGLDIDMICPGHGPVLDTGIPELLDTYDAWCAAGPKNARTTVVMPYVSAYGYTKMIADAIKDGLESFGEIEVRMYDMNKQTKAMVMAEITAADGVLFGSPTILSEALYPIYDLTISMFPGVHGGKYASAFGSYGWTGEAVPHLIERLKQLKMKVEDEGFRIRFKPSEEELAAAREFGKTFGMRVLGREA